MDIEWGEEGRQAELNAYREDREADFLPMDRLDMLLPTDLQTGMATATALQAYLSAMMEMATRGNQPLSVISVGADDCPALRLFMQEDVSLLAHAIARCLRQETRGYDVIGRMEDSNLPGLPTFVIVCPLMNEDHAAQLAERLLTTMSAYASDAAQDWLTISIGVVGMGLDMSDAATLLLRAGATLLRAQRQGGKQVWRHSDTLRQIIEKHYSEAETQGDEA